MTALGKTALLLDDRNGRNADAPALGPLFGREQSVCLRALSAGCGHHPSFVYGRR